MSKNKTVISTQDYLVTQELFDLEYIPETDMLITKPQPEDLSKYYDPDNYISHSDKKESILEKVYQLVKTYTLKNKVKLINQHSNKNKTLLDIGCGTGEFLTVAKKNNWDTVGVELNNNARKKASKKNLILYKTLNEIEQDKYNTITLWHVLEHLQNLKQQIEKIDNLLDKNGTLIIAVPNYKSYDAQYYKEHWAAYDTPRHLWHFSQSSISKLFSTHQLKVIKTLPMYFDSYYVSLLSEKYKNGKSNYIKAFYRGMLSNISAKGTGEYSSLIYVLKKD